MEFAAKLSMDYLIQWLCFDNGVIDFLIKFFVNLSNNGSEGREENKNFG